MHKGFLKVAAILGFLSVALGAFAAHALKEMVSDHAVATFETGVRYQFYHAFALLAVGILFQQFKSGLMVWAGRFFIAGVILFSGSLYALTMVQATVQPGYKWIGPITPLGGVCFLLGWLCMLIAFFKKN
jgi:uncharacterized membrane protein YgdD (TMEM256/DUF423 family)